MTAHGLSNNEAAVATPDQPPVSAPYVEAEKPDSSEGGTEHSSQDLPSEDRQVQPGAQDAGEMNAQEDAEKSPAAPPQDEQKDFERQSVGKRAIVMLALCMAVFLAALDVTIVVVALPTIAEDFDSGSGYTWVGAAFLLGNCSTVSLWGKFSDIFGRKPVLLVANVVFLLGSLISAISKDMTMLIAGRTVQGIGAAGLVILVNISIADLFSMRNRGQYYGIIGGIWALASAIGPVIGGALTEKVSWRWCFYINLPLDGIAFIIILFFLKLKTPTTPLFDGLKAIDWLGAMTVIGATLMFLFGLDFGGDTHPWDSAIVICLLIFGIVTFGLFLVIEWKVSKYPLAPVALFSTTSLRANFFIVSMHGMVFIATSYYLPLYFQACRGASPLIAGVYLLPNCVAFSIGSLGVGIWIRKTGRYMEAIWGGLFLMTVGFGLLINLDADSSLAKIIIYQLIAGLGVGPLFQAPLISLQSQVKARDMATATATLGFVRQLSTSISVVVGSVIYENELEKKRAALIAALGVTDGTLLSGVDAAASVTLIDDLSEPGKTIAQDAFADSLSKMWILYTCLSFLGLCSVWFLKKNTLSKQYEENKVGLAAEEERVAERKAEAAERQRKKQALMGASGGAKVAGSDSDLEMAGGEATQTLA